MRTVSRLPGALTVTELNEFVKRLLDASPVLSEVEVRGEISNFKNHYGSGHLYFSLKDEMSQIKAVMFRSAAARLKFDPEDGMKVSVRGRVSSYPRDGSVQLYADSIEPEGVGALYIAYEQLKNRLAAEGLFDPSRKKLLPKLPTRIGVITSPTGAAIRDMINVTGRRFPAAKILLYPSLVQGAEAPAQLIAGIKVFNERCPVDVIIIGRGGGSIEDLWAFNDEGLARAVASSRIPVISAVGHETDFTICDFAADMRAPTPSAAAELAVPDTGELRGKLEHLIEREAAILAARLQRCRERLGQLAERRVLTDPASVVEDRRMLLDHLTDGLCRVETKRLENKRASLREEAAKLGALNPLAVLSRGYSAVYKEDGALVKEISNLTPGESARIVTVGGAALCTVDEIIPDKNVGDAITQ
ncbi:MAG: exodeoxyribonuclease VII large subunit [Clostridia bacterium]|nr:exodeoxyribonuclease VII large subunit [Clostridia bacterium]